MPNGPVPAAATGLPKCEIVEPEMGAAFHLLIGRELAGVVTERDLMEKMAQAADPSEPIDAIYLRGAIDHLNDREDALLAVTAAFPSTTLAGAAIQLFAAIRVFDRITLFQDPDPADERAMRRLLWAAGDVVADAAGLDRKTDGPDALAGSHCDPWRDVFARLAQVKSAIRDAEPVRQEPGRIDPDNFQAVVEGT